MEESRVLKSKIVFHYGSQANAAREMGISEPRSSCLINGREKARPVEREAFKVKLGVELSLAE